MNLAITPSGLIWRGTGFRGLALLTHTPAPPPACYMLPPLRGYENLQGILSAARCCREETLHEGQKYEQGVQVERASYERGEAT